MKKNKIYRQAVFILVYAKVKDKINYVILKRKLHWKGWEFPKGGIEKGENLINVVKREVKEETGLKALKIKKFNIFGKYLYNKKYPDRRGYVGQTYKLFSAEVKKGKIKVDKREHYSGRWLDFNKALKILKWKNQKKCLRIVNNYLINNP